MRTILLSAVIAAISVSAFSVSGEVLPLKQNTEPKQGIVDKFGSVRIYNQGIPVPNPECKEPAKLYINDVEIDAIESTSTRVQRFVMQSDDCFTLNFSTKAYTLSGEYKVTVPENFVTYNDGADCNAAAEFFFTVPEPVRIVSEPPTPIVDSMPHDVTLTFEGVKEVIDNKKTGGADSDFVIRFLHPDGVVIPTITIEGNVMHLHFGADGENPNPDQGDYPEEESLDTYTVSEENYTSIGEYTLIFPEGTLTYVLEDGTSYQNFQTLLTWSIPRIPYPSCEPAQGEVSELKDFSLTLTDGMTFYIVFVTPSVYSVDEFGLVSNERIASFSRVDTGSVSGKSTIEYTLNEAITTPGRYAVKMGRSGFGVHNEDGESLFNNCDYYYYYTVTSPLTGVESVVAEALCGDVYTATGILVGRGMTTEEVSALPAGLYIVGGRKIIRN